MPLGLPSTRRRGGLLSAGDLSVSPKEFRSNRSTEKPQTPGAEEPQPQLGMSRHEINFAMGLRPETFTEVEFAGRRVVEECLPVAFAEHFPFIEKIRAVGYFQSFPDVVICN